MFVSAFRYSEGLSHRYHIQLPRATILWQVVIYYLCSHFHFLLQICEQRFGFAVAFQLARFYANGRRIWSEGCVHLHNAGCPNPFFKSKLYLPLLKYLANPNYLRSDSTVIDSSKSAEFTANKCPKRQIVNGKSERDKGKNEGSSEISASNPSTVSFDVSQFDPVSLNSLPSANEPIPIKLMYAIDPGLIYFRLNSWVSVGHPNLRIYL